MVITAEDLNIKLTAFISNAVSVLDKYDYAIFKNLFDYGFRYSELQYIHAATINGSGNYEFVTLKNNNKRIYTYSELSPTIIKEITDGFAYSSRRSRQTYIRIMQQQMNGNFFRTGFKECSMHIFRHNRIKQMYMSGMSIAEIKSFTGLKQDETVNKYIDSVIQIIP